MKHKRFGAATHATVQGANQTLIGWLCAKGVSPYLGVTGTDVPEGMRHHRGIVHVKMACEMKRVAASKRLSRLYCYQYQIIGLRLAGVSQSQTESVAELLLPDPTLFNLASYGATIMARRRVLFVLLVLVCSLGVLGFLAQALAPGGFGVLDGVILLAIATTMPWFAVGFCNGMIGLWLTLFYANPLDKVSPSLCAVPLPRDGVEQSVNASQTALLLCIRNEMPARLVRNMTLMLDSLLASGSMQRFHLYVLSDTVDEAWITKETEAIAVVTEQWREQMSITYRRREINTGFKAGNIKDFCQQWGADHELAVVLDADSLMSAQALNRLVDTMHRRPEIGILQGLVVGLPSRSAFTRFFQFGMRLGMRSYTLGSAWWQGDCGPYWGHNAAIRLKPFIEHCQLPVLKDRRGQPIHVLSHDQLEAVLMRRAGFEVRVFPIEDESFEENPLNLLDFVQRDLRWCAGNMQYLHFLMLPGLQVTSRVQLVLAILMFLAGPAWLLAAVAMVALISTAPTLPAVLDLGFLWAALIGLWALILAPKLVSVFVVVLQADQRRAFGGARQFAFGILLETFFSILISPVMWFSQTIAVAGLLFGKRATWAAQNRDDASLGWATAVRVFGLHAAFGLLLALPLVFTHPQALPLLALFVGGLWVVIPLAVLSAKPSVGEFFCRRGWLAVPDEVQPCALIESLQVAQNLSQPVAGSARAGFESGQ